MNGAELPPGWSWATFGEVARIASNLVDPASFPNLPHIAPNHIQAKTGRLLPYTTVAADGVTSPKHWFDENAILYSKIRPYLAKVTYPGFIGLCSADVYPVTTNLNRRYLLHWLLSDAFTAHASAAQGRTVLPKVNQDSLNRMPVPVPPMAEQSRIVAELERRLSHVDAAERSIRATLRKVQEAKASVHEATRTGSLLSTIYPAAWNSVMAGDVTDVRGGIQKQPKRQPVLNKYPFLRVANVGRGALDLADVHEVELFGEELTTYRLQRGDLLVVEGNGSVDQIGRAARWDGAIADCVHQNHLIRVRPGARVDSHFLELVWNAPSTIAQLIAVASSTSGLHTLSTGKIKVIQLRIPDLQTQQALATEAARRLSLLAAAERSLSRQLVRCSAARSSILAAAFTGQLVPQDPSDEPATCVLARIKEQRAVSDPPKKTTRKLRAKKETIP